MFAQQGYSWRPMRASLGTATDSRSAIPRRPMPFKRSLQSIMIEASLLVPLGAGLTLLGFKRLVRSRTLGRAHKR